MKVKCIKKPCKDDFIETAITIDVEYDVKRKDGADYLLIDDNGNDRFYQMRFFEKLKTDKNQMTIFEEIKKEREAQDKQWGIQTHPCINLDILDGGIENKDLMCDYYGIFSEKLAKYSCDSAFKRGVGTYAHIALEELSEVVSEFDIHKRREELVQLTAVCVAWLESIDRQLKSTYNETSRQ